MLRERAVAVLEGKPPVVRVIALNEKARLLGMEAGMTKLQAAVFAAPAERSPAVLRQRSPEQENSAHSALLDVAHAFTPRVEDTAADTLLLDLAGLERLYGAPAKMARDLASRVSAVGLEANIAIAANPDAAMHAARGFSGVTVIPAGKEAQRLGVLPLQVLLEAFEISSQKTLSCRARTRKVARADARYSGALGGARFSHAGAVARARAGVAAGRSRNASAAPGARRRHADSRTLRADFVVLKRRWSWNLRWKRSSLCRLS